MCIIRPNIIGIVPISPDQIRWTNGATSIAQSIALSKAGHRGIRLALATTQVQW